MQQNYSKKIEPIQKASKNTASSVLDASSQSEALQRKADMANNAAQREEAPRPNNTGMPDNLKSGIESLSGFSMDDVRVHYNSSKPATVQALAYTQGTDIHVAPGQEKHLPHEAWHVAQQMAGRVSPTTNINGMPVNDNAALEHEADVMGGKAEKQKIKQNKLINTKNNISSTTKQLIFKKGSSILDIGCGIACLINTIMKPKLQPTSNTVNLLNDLNGRCDAFVYINNNASSAGETKIVSRLGPEKHIQIKLKNDIYSNIEKFCTDTKIDDNKNSIASIATLTHELSHARDLAKGTDDKYSPEKTSKPKFFYIARTELKAWKNEALSTMGYEHLDKERSDLVNSWLEISEKTIDSNTLCTLIDENENCVARRLSGYFTRNKGEATSPYTNINDFLKEHDSICSWINKYSQEVNNIHFHSDSKSDSDIDS